MFEGKTPVIGSTFSGVKDPTGQRIITLLGYDSFYYLFTRSAEDIFTFTEQIARQEAPFFVLWSGDSGADEAIKTLLQYQQQPVKTAILLMKGGTANNLAGILRLSDVHEAARIARGLASKRLSLDDYVKPTDVIKINFDANQTHYTATSFNIGLISQVCYYSERKATSLLDGFLKDKGLKTIIYGANAVRGAFTYKPIKAEITYEFCSGEKKTTLFSDLFNINVVNGEKHAAITKWNPKGLPCDGELEVACFKSMSLFRMSLIVGRMVLNRHTHITPHKGKDGYNPYGVNYAEKVKGLEMRVLDNGGNDPLYVEAGGNAWPIEKPEMPIKAEIIPGAIKFVYGKKK